MGDKFRIKSTFRFMLVVRLLTPIVMVVILIWAISSPYLEMTEIGPLIIIGFVAWAGYEGYKLSKWYSFAITISDEALKVKDKSYSWDDFISAWAKDAFQFQTFIALTTKDGEIIKIPAVIEQNAFVLKSIEKRFPQLERKS